MTTARDLTMYKIAQAPTVLELTMEELVSRNNPIAKQKNNSKKTKSSSGKSSSNICQKYYTDYDCSSSYGSSAVPTKLSLPSAIDQRLYPLQKEGVNWMHGLFLANCGGILGDDMGLGKTFQVTSLLVGLLLQNKVQNVLIISPVSVTASWMKELDEHLLSHVHSTKTVLINSELSKDKRRRLLDKAFANSYNSNKRTIVVSSYELVANMVDGFAGNDRLWDYVVLDEGHTIKNANTKKCKAMNELRCKHKLLLTGTPIQNNLKEFWTIINWVTDGKLFGSLSQFQEQFEGPIVSGQDPNVPVDKQKVSTEAVKLLMRLMKPILLQRKKSEHAKILKLQQKMEMTMWIPLSERQRDLYQNYLNSLDFHFTINRTGYPVEAVNYLKTVCRHPFLLEATAKKKEAKERKGSDCDNIDKLISQLADIGLEDSEENDSSYHLGKTVFDIANRKPMVDELLRDSVKLKVLIELTQRLCNAKHRLLIFSQSKLMLDIIEESLQEKNLSSCRIDGSIAGRDRQVIIDKFNLGRDGIDICLLTTKACNCGVTLTGADRVIIYDPSWNPGKCDYGNF